jgi:hypothetical protein
LDPRRRGMTVLRSTVTGGGATPVYRNTGGWTEPADQLPLPGRAT